MSSYNQLEFLWYNRFMWRALKVSEKSKDPHTQVGACIVNKCGEIVGEGCNNFPDGCTDEKKFPWDKKAKNLYVCHAELNAILNKKCESLHDCILYVTLFPCNLCAKAVIESGIREVVFMKHQGPDKAVSRKASENIFDAAGVNYRILNQKPDENIMQIAFWLSQKSKDPKRKVGACIIDQEGHIVGQGYNQFPEGCTDPDIFRWNTKDCDLYVVHAELSAIMQKKSGSLLGCSLFVTQFPCNECAKAITASGIKEVVFPDYQEAESEDIKISWQASEDMFKANDVKLRPLYKAKKAPKEPLAKDDGESDPKRPRGD